MTIPVDETFVVVMNPTHRPTRQQFTLMEEYFHILLRHKPSRIYSCPLTGIVRREFNQVIEQEAKCSAAAALVPYSELRRMVLEGVGPTVIAETFEVSEQLVNFRLNVTKLKNKSRRI